jgi:hypothetical protein
MSDAFIKATSTPDSTRSEYQQLSDLLSIAVDTGNRDYADEVYATVLRSPGLTEEQRAELFRDYNEAVEAGEV